MTPLVCSNLLTLRGLMFAKKEVKRNVSFRKIRAAYQNYWRPVSVSPPYRHTCQTGDPVLRARASPVDPEIIATRGFQKLLEHMKNVMRSYDAVGLAAPQIGISLQIFIAELTEDQLKTFDKYSIKNREIEAFPLKVFINPTLKIRDYKILKFPEGCLSIRGFTAEVPRARAVSVSGLDATGASSTWESEGWSARIAQHEMDHLNGTLLIDKMDPSTFECTAWEDINKNNGRMELRYDAK